MSGEAEVSGWCLVQGRAVLTDRSRARDFARVISATLTEDSRLHGFACVKQGTLAGAALAQDFADLRMKRDHVIGGTCVIARDAELYPRDSPPLVLVGRGVGTRHDTACAPWPAR